MRDLSDEDLMLMLLFAIMPEERKEEIEKLLQLSTGEEKRIPT